MKILDLTQKYLSRYLTLAIILSSMVVFHVAASTVKCSEQPILHESRINQNILKGIDLLYDWHFEDAEKIFKNVIARKPKNPEGYFYLAMVTWSRLASGFWTADNVAEYRERIDSTIEITKGRITNNQFTSFDYFFLGGALGFKGRFEMMQENWIPAFFFASEAVSALKTCREMDPKNREVLLGLGIFEYYTARLSGVLKWLSYLLIHTGDKSEGLKKLTLAANEAIYSATESKSMLIHIYLFVEEDFEKALDLCDDLSNKYKNNSRYLFLKGVTYIRLGMDSKYEWIVEKLRQKGLRASSNTISRIWEKRAQYLESVYDMYGGRYDEARLKLNSILKHQDPLNDPAMIAWPLIKIGMIHDLEGNREKAFEFYHRILEMENGAGAQFLVKNFMENPPTKQDPFIGY